MKVLVAFCILGLVSLSRQAPTVSSPAPDTQDCPKNHSSPKTFPHPTSCHKYLQCANGTKVEMECPIGQQYNKDLGVCDNPRFANCKLVSNDTTAPSANGPAKDHSITSAPRDVTTEGSATTIKIENSTSIKDENKSKEKTDVGTNDTKPLDKSETTTSKIETTSEGATEKVTSSGKQNETVTTISTDLSKRTNETSNTVDTTATSAKESSSAKPEGISTTPSDTLVTGEIKVKDEAESKEEEEKETEKPSPEKKAEKPSDAKTETTTEVPKKEEVTTIKAGDSKEVTKPGDKPEATTEAKDAKVRKSSDSKEVTKPELGGEEERKKSEGKKPVEDEDVPSL